MFAIRINNTAVETTPSVESYFVEEGITAEMLVTCSEQEFDNFYTNPAQAYVTCSMSGEDASKFRKALEKVTNSTTDEELTALYDKLDRIRSKAKNKF